MSFGPTAPQNIFQGTATLTNGERPFIAGDLSYSYSSFNFGTVLYVADRIDARGDRKARDLALLRALEERYGDCVVYVEAGWDVDVKDWMAHFERERNLFGELLAFLEETKLELARARVRAKDVLADFRLEQRHRRPRVPALGVVAKVFTRPALRARSPRRRTNVRVRRRSTKPKAWTRAVPSR